MGWSIYYRIRCDRDWTDSDRHCLQEHVQRWSGKLSRLSEPYDVGGLFGRNEFHGATRPAPSPRAALDYVTIVQALRELEELFPEAEVRVSDDSGIHTDSRPNEIDLEALRDAMLDVWGTGEAPEEGNEAEDFEVDALRQAAELERAREEARPLLEKAAKDFEIWKNAQRKKQDGS